MIRAMHGLALATTAVTAACGLPQPDGRAQIALATGPQCFRANQLYAYRTGPDGLVSIRTVNDRWFSMRLSGGCPDFAWIMKIGIRPMESSWLCEGMADELIAPHPGQENRCYVSDIHPSMSEAAS